MKGTIIAFAIWSIVGCAVIGFGIYAFFSKKAMGFWANAEPAEVTDAKKYNAAVGKLFCTYGVIFILLGLPLLSGQNSAWSLLSVVGVVAESIGAMIVYSIVIEEKYRKK